MRIDFKIDRAVLYGVRDHVLVNDGEDPLERVIEQAVSDIAAGIMLTIGDITMSLAAWQDPDHWSDDWAEHADGEDAVTFVAGLLAGAGTA